MKRFAFFILAVLVSLLVIATIITWKSDEAGAQNPPTTATLTYSCGGTNLNDSCWMTFNGKGQYADYATVVWTINYAHTNYTNTVIIHNVG